MLAKHFAHARFYDDANRRMLASDPVKRDLNGYRYCDDDPVTRVDPDGEFWNIVVGAGLGGVFGGIGGFVSSAVSQKLDGEKVNWKKAWGSAANGFIVGAVQGGLVASGAGIPVALASNFLAGTAGSAAEQYISEGKIDAGKSITSGLTNAVSNAIYGTKPLKGVINAGLRGAGAGAATAGINYISDFIRQNPGYGGTDAGLLAKMAGRLVSPYGLLRDPRKGCGSFSPFAKIPGYDSAKGFQYSLPGTDGLREQKKKFDFGEFLGKTIFGGVVGGFTSAGFYGAGKGIERLKDGFRVGKSGSKAKLDYVTSNGLVLETTPNKTTTVLGTYKSDTGAILDELGNVKSLDFGPRDGGFNLLNTPDELYVSPNQFWNEYNKPWLDNAIARNDIFKIATEPKWDNLTRINMFTGKTELTGFGREYTYLKKHGYYFDAVTKTMVK